MLISDIDKRPDVTLLTDSQDVTQILQDLHCEEDYGGIFLFDGKAWGFEGNVPYLNKTLYEIGEWPL
jgi:hypothetical protein